MKNRRPIIVIAAGLAALLFAALVWPTAYRYDHWGVSNQPVRINRFTGAAELLEDDGWTPMVKLPARDPLPSAVDKAPRSSRH